MSRTIVVLVLVLLLALVLSFQIAKVADAGDWTSLFNGKDLSGWTYHLSEDNAKVDDVWTVKDGVLKCAGKPRGYIRTEKDYENYVLKLQWRFDPEKGPGNSGVLLRVVGEDKVWPKSIEAQLKSLNAGDIWNIDKMRMTVDPERTEGRRTIKLHETNEKPLGEWNEYEITVDHGTVTLKVNGLVQNVATECEEVAGKIALQSEGAAIDFRNIELKPLD